MATISKKQLVDQIAATTQLRQRVVKEVVQKLLDCIVMELGRENRLEFRNFGVFEVKHRKARRAQNPKTLAPVVVPASRTVKFKVGRVMKMAVQPGRDKSDP